MHPPRRSRALGHSGTVDRLIDWLLATCPFSTLTVLILLVMGPLLPATRPLLIAIPVVVADAALNAFRRVRRRRLFHDHAPA